jgi:tetratricopeptide (TPR) repeat protein
MKFLVYILSCFACIMVQPTISEAQNSNSYNDAVLDSLLSELHRAKDDTNKTKLYYKVAERYGLHDPKLFSEYVHIGKAHAEKHQFGRAAAVFVSMLGAIKHDEGDIDSTLWYYNKAYELHQKNGDERNMALLLIDISNVYNWQGNNVEAIRYLTRSLPILEKIKDYENLAITYANFATLYIQEENFKKALEYALKAWKSANTGKVEYRYANVYNTLGTIYAGLKDTVKAETYTRRSIGYAKKHHRNYELAQAYNNLASYTNDDRKQLDYLLASRKVWEQISPEHPVATTVLGRIGKLYLRHASEKEKNEAHNLSQSERARLLDSAEKYIDMVLSLSKKNDYTQNVMHYLGVKAQLAAERGDYKRAYFDFEDHLKLYDSLYSQENKNRISQIESENELLLRDQKIAGHENRMKEMWLYGIIILISVILAFTFFLYRNKVNNLTLKNTLADQEAKQKEAEIMLQYRIMESELKVVRTQMNPHFIFNVLNNIESYILDNDRKTASRLIQKFAKLSRLILENSTQNLVPLTRDWMALQLYAELEALRFNHQFTYSFQVHEEVDVNRWLIPPMLIQPLVENAIHHGLRLSSAEYKKVEVDVRIEDEHLVFSISDNGIGLSRSKELKTPTNSYKEKSIGLASVRERLELFNLNKSTSKAYLIMQEKDEDASGTVVQIFFPLLETDS